MIITKAYYGKYLVMKSKLDGDTFEKLFTLTSIYEVYWHGSPCSIQQVRI